MDHNSDYHYKGREPYKELLHTVLYSSILSLSLFHILLVIYVKVSSTGRACMQADEANCTIKSHAQHGRGFGKYTLLISIINFLHLHYDHTTIPCTCCLPMST